ncbi:MAG: type II secretion system protein N [Rudaea sp.]
MRGVLRGALVAVALLAGAVLLAPAALLDHALAQRTQDRVRLVDARGLWWRGSGVLVTADGRSRVPLAWRVALPPLAGGTLVADLVAGNDDGMPSGRVTLRGGSVELHDLRLRLPAAMVGAIVPALHPLSLGGEVALRAPALAWHEGALRGSGDATWQRARIVAASLALDLGSVSASAPPGRDMLGGTVHNTGGDVGIDGTFAQRAGALEASLVLQPTGTTPQMVRAMLPLLGASDGSGAVRVTWRSDR